MDQMWHPLCSCVLNLNPGFTFGTVESPAAKRLRWSSTDSIGMKKLRAPWEWSMYCVWGVKHEWYGKNNRGGPPFKSWPSSFCFTHMSVCMKAVTSGQSYMYFMPFTPFIWPHHSPSLDSIYIYRIFSLNATWSSVICGDITWILEILSTSYLRA